MNKLLVFVAIVSIGVFLILILNNQGNEKPKAYTAPTPQLSLAEKNASPSSTIVPFPSIASISATTGVIKTIKGDITMAFYPEDAPKTVTNFATLAKSGYYNNLTFHRVEDWVVQGGDPTGSGAGGTSIYGKTFPDELNPETESYKTGYVEGVLAMANSGPNTNGSQFFILTKDYPLDHKYTIFGKVTEGMDVVKKIQKGDKILSITVE